MGPVLGVPALARVRSLEPVLLDAFTNLPVRWEVAGPGGSPFPVLDADIVVVPHAEGGTVLAVSGTYRLPLGSLEAQLNPILLHRVAEATIQAFARRLAAAMVAPRPATTGGSRN